MSLPKQGVFLGFTFRVLLVRMTIGGVTQKSDLAGFSCQSDWILDGVGDLVPPSG
jgi:hypothetical protein